MQCALTAFEILSGQGTCLPVTCHLSFVCLLLLFLVYLFCCVCMQFYNYVAYFVCVVYFICVVYLCLLVLFTTVLLFFMLVC